MDILGYNKKEVDLQEFMNAVSYSWHTYTLRRTDILFGFGDEKKGKRIIKIKGRNKK